MSPRRPVIAISSLLLFVAMSATPGLAAHATVKPSRSVVQGSSLTQVGLGEPRPSSRRLLGVSALTSDDVWAVGDEVVGAVTQTLVEHYDGTTWKPVPSLSPGDHVSTLDAVSALTPDDVWAVGWADVDNLDQTLAEHWDGTRWTVFPTPKGTPYDSQLTAVVTLSPTDAWAVGSYRDGYVPLIEHWDGKTWTGGGPDHERFSWLGFSSVSAISPTDIWVVGSGFQDEEAGWLTVTEHWDGHTWKTRHSEHHNRFADHYFRAVTAISHKNIWAVGDELRGQALIEHNTGSWAKLQQKVPQLGGMELDAAASTKPHDVWAAGVGGGHGLILHWNGTTWSASKAPAEAAAHFYAASALTPTDAWVVGTNGSSKPIAEHWNGTAWQLSPSA